MLVNLTSTKFDSLSKSQKEKVNSKYGSVIGIELPILYEENELEEIANDYFIRVTAAMDSCASEPKQNAVCMHISTPLEKKLLSLLLASTINVILNCWE